MSIHREKLYGNPAMMEVELPIKSASGSSMARSLMLLVQYNRTINNVLEKGEQMSVEDTSNVVNLLYECCTMEHDAVQIDGAKHDLLLQILERLFEINKNTTGAEDMKVRLCYVYFCLEQYYLEGGLNRPDIEIVKEGKRRYPDNYHYHVLLFDLYFKCSEFEMASLTMNDAVTKFSSNFCLKLMFRLTKLQVPTYQNEQHVAMEVFDDYLLKTLTEDDDRNLPEVYFRKAHWYLSFEPMSRKLLMVKECYELGRSAEKKQLSCFLPYAKSDKRVEVENYLTNNNITLSI